MSRALQVLGVLLVLLAVVAGGALYQVLHTQAGLDFLVRQLDRIPGTKIEITGARGTLAGPLALARLVVDHEAVHLDARDVRLVVGTAGLVAGRISLDDLRVARLDVRLKQRPPQPKTAPHFLPAALRIEAPGFRLNALKLTLQGGQAFDVTEATGSLVVTRWRVDADPIDVRGPDGRIAGTLALRATEPLGLRTSLRGEWRLPGDAFEYRFRAETKGKLDRLGADLYLDAPAKLRFAGTLLDLTERPRARGTLRLVDFDGSPWVPAGRLPKLTGSIAFGAGTRGIGLDGTLTSPVLPGQPLRVQGGGRWEDHALAIRNLRAWLPRIGLEFVTHGTVALPADDAPEGALPRITLAGEWSGLRWPLEPDAAAIVTSPQGVYTFEGSMPYAYTARAEVAGPSIPTASFDVRGSLDREGLQLRAFDGYVARGRVQATGRVQWTGAQPWSLELNARSLALAEVRRGLDGRLDVAGTIAGSGLTAEAPWTARLTTFSGSLFGRPLTGRGEVAHRDGTFELRGMRVANGASFANVDGRVGARDLDLRWNADLRTLAVVHPDLAGQLVSQGTARGSLTRPRVDAKAQGRQLAFGGVAVAALDATVDLDTSDRQRSHVVLDARAVEVAGVRLDTVHGSLDGTMDDHDLVVAFDSPGSVERQIAEFRAELRADGSLDLDRPRWNGTLGSAVLSFPDGDARLIQPATLQFGPDLQRASPLCLRTAEDARLCIEGEHRPNPQSWRVIYSAQEWPLQRLLRTLLGWQEFDGRLEASGWAEQAPGKPWVGGSTVLVHDPSFEVPRNKFRTERIELGSTRFDVFAEPAEIRANLDLAVDEATTAHGEAFVTRRGSDMAKWPLRGHVEGVSEAIRVLPLLVPEIDRAAGRLRARLTLGGTVGDPGLDGEFHVIDGRIEMYRTNLTIANLQADGAFAGEQLKFAARGDTKKGSLVVEGAFAWPEGVMTGAMHMKGDQLLVADTPEYRVLASPDIVLRSGVDGYVVEGEVAIPTARISPRQLTSSVGASPDERIVGDPEIEEGGPSTAERLRSRVKVVLGNAVRVEAYGLKASLGGDVVVSTVPHDVARGEGAIKVLEGQYKAFGQDVKITRGTLSYAKTPLTEPVVDIIAERKINDADITVAVNVRGTLDKPFVAITSSPAMSDSEALSYLLTGRSIDTLQSGEAADVNQAAENLALSGGGLLLGSLGSRLGLDEVSVERDSNADTSVVLGKALSPKLFVSYGISIAEAINTIKLRYTLNDRWSVKAESGLDQSADVEYRIER